jgi:hypothetical protein
VSTDVSFLYVIFSVRKPLWNYNEQIYKKHTSKFIEQSN